MNTTDQTRRDRQRRLLNQHAYGRYFVGCSCQQGCLLCAYTGLVSRAEAKQVGHLAHPPPAGPPSF